MFGHNSLNRILVDEGLVTAEQMQAAVEEEIVTAKPAARILLERGLISQRDVVRADAVNAGIGYVDVLARTPDPEALMLVPADLARRLRVLPVEITPEGQLVVAMAEPGSDLAADEIQGVTGCPVVRAAGYGPDLAEALDASYASLDPALMAPMEVPPPDPVSDGSNPFSTDSNPLTAPAPAYPGAPEPVHATAASATDAAPFAPAAPFSPAPPPSSAEINGHASTGNGSEAGTFGPDDIQMVEAPDLPDEKPALDVSAERDPNLAEFLEAVVTGKGSDLHLTAGLPPMIRVHGELQPIRGYRRLLPKDLQELVFSILTQKQREKFEENLELDVSYSLPGRARFRVNVFQQRDAVGAVMRLIPYEIKDPESLGLPPAVGEFTKLKRGLVLVTGITGSGKSTTLAALVDIVNTERAEHIMTVEDPIEFLHKHKKAVVNQREVGSDTHSFANALKHVLRQDPDVILVGELRDLETISTALTAAETGHLVFATLHTQDAPQSIDRLIDVFPPHQQQQVRIQLAGTIAGVVSQQLLPLAQGKGRAVAVEVLVATPAVRNLIREGKTHQIYTSMQAGGKYGMQVMDQHLAELVKRNKVTYEAALQNCHKPEEFNRLTGRA